MTTIRFLTLSVLLGALTGRAATAAEPDATTLQKQFAEHVAPFLKSYCFDCHGTERQEAKLDLSGFSSAETVARAHLVWAIVLERLKSGEMPPEDAAPRPTATQREAVINWINSARDFEAARNAGDPGPVLARRLSNAEYDYSIRDLTGVDIQPTKTFPVDPANEAGFDNSGESLTMSPALLKKYLDAARHVAEHLVLRPDGVAFAPHPAVTDTDRDKYCVKRIVAFYERQPTDLADYFFAAWKFRHQAEAGLNDVTLEAVATALHVSPKYLATVWELLADDDADHCVGPIATLQSQWRAFPSNPAMADEARIGCERMRDFVVALRSQLRPGFPDISVEGSHVGSQQFVLWKNRQYVAHRRKFDASVLQTCGETSASATDQKLDSDQKSDASKTADSNRTADANKTSDKIKKPNRNQKPDSPAEAPPVNENLLVPADESGRAAFEVAFARFCSVFPDAFFISERGRDYVKDSQKQMGERGRLLSAGFHSMMGYFRDDQPLYDLILDDASRQELDALWLELDFVTAAPMRQYEGFLWFERTDSRYMRDPQFDFARPEDKAALTEPMIEKLAEVYLAKAVQNGGGEIELEAIRFYFREINAQIRRVEQARIKAEPSHLNAILEFAGRAFRRQLSQAERNELTAFYQELRTSDGLSHEEAIQDTLVSVLMSPLFSYRVDLLGSGSDRLALTDNELASRLSYFLWSSTPDDELLRLAAAGRLHEPEILRAQTRRLLHDPKVRGLATEFGGNWLDFRRFEEHNSVDRNRFPQFTDELRQAMFEEPVRFFVDVAQQNRSVLQFLEARHTFVNPVLARHYGIPEPANGDWSLIENADEYARGGLLPMSVFLTKNAPGLRTSPVKRGYWVVRKLLGERIPPPPPNVPDLPEDESKLGELTLRETLAKHRENKSCAGCHERFDSIGLAFEGFGPVGERRDRDLGDRPVSTVATFPGAAEGNGLADLQTYLRDRRQDEFLENFCQKLLAYALSRSLILPDDLLVRDLRQQLAADGFQFNSLIENIVFSPQFLQKRSASAPASF